MKIFKSKNGLQVWVQVTEPSSDGYVMAYDLSHYTNSTVKWYMGFRHWILAMLGFQYCRLEGTTKLTMISPRYLHEHFQEIKTNIDYFTINTGPKLTAWNEKNRSQG